MKYRISVLMGINNCAPTLQEALDSLYAQTYQDFKIILCDDGSKDDTLKIAEENARLHENVVVIKNPKNMGLNYTLNHCLSVADTEYCARMDGDDVCDPKRFEIQINFLDKHPEYAVVSNPMNYFDESGLIGMGAAIEGEVRKERFNFGSPFCHAPSMVRTEAYKAVGGYTVDKRLLRLEDYNLWMKMYEKGYKGYNLNQHLYSMRDDGLASSRRTLKNRINGVYAHWLAYRKLDLSFILFCKYAIKTIIKGLVPNFVYFYFHRKNIKNGYIRK